MKDKEVMGITFPHDKKFYYLDNGQYSAGPTSIDRLRTVLMARGLLIITDTERTPYRTISLHEAKNEDLLLEPIYVNKHIQSLRQQKAVPASPAGSLWD